MSGFGDGTFGAGTFGSPAVGWVPGMEWPSGTPGGAHSPFWGGYVRFWLRAALAAGNAFTMGADPLDQLDHGNVLSGAVTGDPDIDTESLWVDLSCVALDVSIEGGATSSQGIFSKADAATLSATLRDPAGDFDPFNRDSPYALQGRSRLVPGTPVEAFAEVVDGDTGEWERFWIFTGTADSWGEDWTPRPSERQAELVATDVTKQFVAWDRPEQPPAGAGDTTAERIARIVTFFDWAGEVVDPPGSSAVTLAATTMAQSAWELLNRTTDDELGYVYFDPEGRLRWLNRATWSTLTAPVATFGCQAVATGALDILVDASPSNMDRQLRNTVYAGRAGGTIQTASSAPSIAQYGTFDYKRTDLGLADDTQAADWASYVVVLYAYPQVALADVTALPAVAAKSWEAWAQVLGIRLVQDLVHVVWAPPDRPTHIVDTVSRVVGYSHKISYSRWEWTPQLIAANAPLSAESVFTMGDDPRDVLDAGFVLGFASLVPA